MEDKGEAEEVSEVGTGRKKGREWAKRKMTTDNDDDDGTQKISKRKSTPKKWETSDIQVDSTLHISLGPYMT